MKNTNTIDKDAMREKFEKVIEKEFRHSKANEIDEIEDWFYIWELAYESCLSEFEQVGKVDCSDVNDNSTEFWGELDGSMNYALGTPLFTRKG